MPSAAMNLFWKIWYPLVTRFTRDSRVTFLNYGYSREKQSGGSEVALSEDDEADRPCIQLYHAVVSAVPLAGCRVLEVSCGHGGGASYVARYLKPMSMHAVDRNARAIALCNRHHAVGGLTFSRGDAMGLEFADATFDVVVNIEASHCYSDPARFLREAVRVLRPKGYFLYADFRERGEALSDLRRHLDESRLEVVACEDISANVVRGMDLNTEKYTTLISRLVPGMLVNLAKRFAGVPGSMIYEELKSGKTVYLRYVLRKP